jgi:hypothetical protein
MDMEHKPAAIRSVDVKGHSHLCPTRHYLWLFLALALGLML